MADPFQSNGTCYYAAGKVADPAYIPCGNSAFGTVPCCQRGDFCLSDNACFNNQFGNVYLAGCTNGDTYNNEAACPRKYTLGDQQWVGMVRCFVSSDKSKADEIWQGCHESVQPLNTIGEQCKCTKDLPGGLYTRASPDLPRQAILPITRGGPITFASGYGPSNTAVTATSKVNLTEVSLNMAPATPASGWSTIGSNPNPTGDGAVPYTGSPGSNTNEGAGGDGGGLSTGAKAGIGVGAAVGGLAIIGILYCLFILNRRLARPPSGAAPSPGAEASMAHGSPAPDYQYAYVHAPLDTLKPQHAATAFVHPSELEGSNYHVVGPEAHGWKSELPADNNAGMFQAQMTQRSASPSLASPGLHSQFSGSEHGNGHGGTDDYAYSRDRASVVSSTRGSDYNSQAAGYVSPQSTGDGSGAGYHTHARNGSQVGTMDAIHEMRG